MISTAHICSTFQGCSLVEGRVPATVKVLFPVDAVIDAATALDAAGLYADSGDWLRLDEFAKLCGGLHAEGHAFVQS